MRTKFDFTQLEQNHVRQGWVKKHKLNSRKLEEESEERNTIRATK